MDLRTTKVELTKNYRRYKNKRNSPLIHVHPLTRCIDSVAHCVQIITTNGSRELKQLLPWHTFLSFLVLCEDEEEAKEAITHVNELLDALELTLHLEKTMIKNFSEGVDFLGFTVYIGHKVPRKEAVKIANVNWLYMRPDGWSRMRLHAFKEKKKSYLSNTRIRNDFLKNLGLKSLSTNLSFLKKGFLYV